jgi:hypothetical protein
VVGTYACENGMGAVLMQQGKPIAYISKALGERNRHLSIYEKESLALNLAWRNGEHTFKGVLLLSRLIISHLHF